MQSGGVALEGDDRRLDISRCLVAFETEIKAASELTEVRCALECPVRKARVDRHAEPVVHDVVVRDHSRHRARRLAGRIRRIAADDTEADAGAKPRYC